MRTLPLLAALAVMAAAAGCTNAQESTDEERTRGVMVNMPENATRLVVDVTANAPGGAHLRVAVDANGTVLDEGSFDAAGEDDELVLEVDTGGAQLVGVQVTARGDAIVHLVLHAVMPDGSRTVLRDEWFTVAATA